MKHSKGLWLVVFFLPVIVFILSPAVFVYLADPLWQWNHPFHIPGYHRGFDERLQKTNYLASRRLHIDTVVIGSSRTAYTDPLIYSEKGFNYATSSGQMSNFAEYLNFIRQRNSMPIEKVVLEATFFGAIEKDRTIPSPESIISQARDWRRKLQLLFSRDAADKARNVLFFWEIDSGLSEEDIIRLKSDRYFVSFGKFCSFRSKKYVTEDLFEKRVKTQVKTYEENVYNMPYNDRYQQFLQDVHKVLPNAKYIVYTTPVTKYLLEAFYKQGRLDDYARWLKELVREFELVYNFMYPNSITLDDSSFADAHHPRPQTVQIIAKKIQDPASLPPGDWGTLVTEENLDEHLRRVRFLFSLHFGN